MTILFHTRKKLFIFAVLLFSFINLAGAHHSGAMFDRSQELRLEGEVLKWNFTNPHSWLQVYALHDGEENVVWGLESSSTSFLLRQGYRRTSMQPGDKVTVDYNPLRDGEAGGTLVRVILADGTVLGRALEGGVNPIPNEEDEKAPLGALSLENLNKDRPAPPFDLTGTWFIDSEWRFLPMPKLKRDAQALVDLTQEYREKGLAYNNPTGKCWPPGMPIIMTRVWPIHMVQLPTSVFMVSNFENQNRWIFMDGREHTDADSYSFSYNGESIGHWEGDTLVVESRHFESENHLIDAVPVSEQLRITERIQLLSPERLRIEYTMTDPLNWEGEWVSLKEYRRENRSDFLEVHCLPNSNDGMSGTSDNYSIDAE